MRFIQKIFFVLGLGFISGGYLYAQSGFGSEAEMKKQAEKYFEKKDYAQATPLYTQLLSVYPKDPDLNYRCGICLLNTSADRAQAVSCLKKAAESAPETRPADVHYHLGRAYMLTEQVDEAYAQFETFKNAASGRDLENSDVNRQMEMCKNALNLMSTSKILDIQQKEVVGRDAYYTGYNLETFKVKVITTPDEYRTSTDKKKNANNEMFFFREQGLMLISSYGETGKTGKDLYIITGFSSGTKGKVENLGSNVNSPYDEDFPYITPDGKTIYFSSNGHNSIGGFDIFKATLNPTAKTWVSTENLGTPVNSTADDFFYVFRTDQGEGAFSTGRETSNDKVSVFRFKTAEKPIQYVVVTGKFSTPDPQKENEVRISVLTDDKSRMVGILKPNRADNTYSLAMKAGREFILKVEYPGYGGVFESLDLAIPGDQQKTIAFVENASLTFDVAATSPNEQELAVMNRKLTEWRNKTGNRLAEPEVFTLDKNESIVINEADVPVAKAETKPVNKNLSNQEIVESAYADADTLKAEAKRLYAEAEDAKTISNRKINAIKVKQDEYAASMRDAETTTDAARKDALLRQASFRKSEADILKKESELLSFKSHQKFEMADRKQREADFALNNAKNLEQSLGVKVVRPVDSTAMADEETRLKVQEEMRQSMIRQNNLKAEADNLMSQAEGLRAEAAVLKSGREKDETLTRAYNLEDKAKKRQEELAAEKLVYADLDKKAQLIAMRQDASGKTVTKVSTSGMSVSTYSLGTEMVIDAPPGMGQPGSAPSTIVQGDNSSGSETAQRPVENQPQQVSKNNAGQTTIPESPKETGSLPENNAIAKSETKPETSNADQAAPSGQNSGGQPGTISPTIGAGIIQNQETREVIQTETATESVIPVQARDLQYEAEALRTEAEGFEQQSKELSQKARITEDREEKRRLNQEAISAMNAAADKRVQADQKNLESQKIQAVATVKPDGPKGPPPPNVERVLNKTSLQEVDKKAIIKVLEEGNMSHELAVAKLAESKIYSDSSKKVADPEIRKMLNREAISLANEATTLEMNAELKYSEAKVMEEKAPPLFADPSPTALGDTSLKQKGNSLENYGLPDNTYNPETGISSSVQIPKGTEDEYMAMGAETEEQREAVDQFKALNMEAATLKKDSKTLANESKQTNNPDEKKKKMDLAMGFSMLAEEKQTAAEGKLSAAGLSIEKAQGIQSFSSALPTTFIQPEGADGQKLANKEADLAVKPSATEGGPSTVSPYDLAKQAPARKLVEEGRALYKESLALSKQAGEVEFTAQRLTEGPSKKSFTERAAALKKESDFKLTTSQEKFTEAEALVPGITQGVVASLQNEGTEQAGQPLAIKESNTSKPDAISQPTPTPKPVSPPKKQTPATESPIPTSHPDYPKYIEVSDLAAKAKTNTETAFATATNLDQEFKDLAGVLATQKDLAANAPKKKDRKEAAAQVSLLEPQAAEKKRESDSAFAAAELLAGQAAQYQKESEQILLSMKTPVVVEEPVPNPVKVQELAETKPEPPVARETPAEQRPALQPEQKPEAVATPSPEIVPPVAVVNPTPQKQQPAATVPTGSAGEEGLIFKIQVAAVVTPPDLSRVNTFGPISTEPTGTGLTRYLSGTYQAFDDAISNRDGIRSAGFRDAFIVAYRNGRRVNITQARAEATASQNENGQIRDTGPQGSNPGEMFYTIQVGVFRRPDTPEQLSELPDLQRRTTANGLNRYTTGIFGSYAAASAALPNVKTTVKDAFIIALSGGNPISLQQASRLQPSLPTTQGNQPTGNNRTPPETTNRRRPNRNGQEQVFNPATTPPLSVPSSREPAIKLNADFENADLVYRIFLGSFQGNVPFEIVTKYLSVRSSGIANLKNEDGTSRFYAGKTKSASEANAVLKKCQEAGIQGATMVAMKGKAEVNLQEAASQLQP